MRLSKVLLTGLLAASDIYITVFGAAVQSAASTSLSTSTSTSAPTSQTSQPPLAADNEPDGEMFEIGGDENANREEEEQKEKDGGEGRKERKRNNNSNFKRSLRPRGNPRFRRNELEGEIFEIEHEGHLDKRFLGFKHVANPLKAVAKRVKDAANRVKARAQNGLSKAEEFYDKHENTILPVVDQAVSGILNLGHSWIHGQGGMNDLPPVPADNDWPRNMVTKFVHKACDSIKSVTGINFNPDGVTAEIIGNMSPKILRKAMEDTGIYIEDQKNLPERERIDDYEEYQSRLPITHGRTVPPNNLNHITEIISKAVKALAPSAVFDAEDGGDNPNAKLMENMELCQYLIKRFLESGNILAVPA